MKTLIAIAALVAIAVPAAAQVSAAAPQMVVKYSDLDLTRPAGADAMILRIRQAAATTCRGFSTRELAQAAKHRACLEETTAAAVKQVGAPLVSARFGAPENRQLATK
jgi:UrcA family protein